MRIGSEIVGFLSVSVGGVCGSLIYIIVGVVIGVLLLAVIIATVCACVTRQRTHGPKQSSHRRRHRSRHEEQYWRNPPLPMDNYAYVRDSAFVRPTEGTADYIEGYEVPYQPRDHKPRHSRQPKYY